MSVTGLRVFDETLQLTHSWLKDLMQRLDWDNRQDAYAALRAVLHALRDRMSVDEAAQLGAQLPMLIRGFYYEGWHPAHKPLKERHKAQFFDHVGREMRRDGNFDPEPVVEAVFELLADRVSVGEIDDIKGLLPAELKALWPA
ncbi:MAG: DUF2267 domain-containing protein [Inquilinus sp.]|nr:DUF2267 domain-containing protein [Inquilinus sp.]